MMGIFGHGNVAGLGQALDEHGGRELPYLQPKNEQAMVHTAAAFAKARRRLGTYACTTSVGPGATNMVTGAATATINRLPVLLLPGDVFANRLPAPVLQQLESPRSQDMSVNDCFRPVSRYWDRINRPEQLLAALPEAMRVLSRSRGDGRGHPRPARRTCRRRPTTIPAHFFDARVYVVARPRPDAAGGRDGGGPAARGPAAADRGRRRRVLLRRRGGTASRFAEATGIPVAVTQAGKGTLPDEHPRCLGAIGVTGTLAANRLAADADLVLVLGSRLSDFTTASKTQFQHDRVRFVSVNVNAADAAKHGALPLVADARAALADLSAALAGHRVARRLRPGDRRGPRGVGGGARADPPPGAARRAASSTRRRSSAC